MASSVVNSVARVTLLQTSSSGDVTPVTLHKKKRKKKSNRGVGGMFSGRCLPCGMLGKCYGPCSVL